MATIVFVLAAYLIGSIPFALLASRAFGLPDPRTYGSGNPGATNVLRTGKKAAAGLTLLGDAAKGFVAVLLAKMLAPAFGVGAETLAAVALAAFFGHVFSLFLNFHGGKGVATALGVLLALNPWLGLAVLATWLAVAGIWRISSLAAVTAAVLAPVYGVYFFGFDVVSLAILIMASVLVWRHKSNIQNLLSGKEDRIGKGEDTSRAAQG